MQRADPELPSTVGNYPTKWCGLTQFSESQSSSSSFFLRFILFLERGEGKEKERERNINVWLPLVCPTQDLGTWTATQACALTGNGTRKVNLKTAVGRKNLKALAV